MYLDFLHNAIDPVILAIIAENNPAYTQEEMMQHLNFTQEMRIGIKRQQMAGIVSRSRRKLKNKKELFQFENKMRNATPAQASIVKSCLPHKTKLTCFRFYQLKSFLSGYTFRYVFVSATGNSKVNTSHSQNNGKPIKSRVFPARISQTKFLP